MFIFPERQSTTSTTTAADITTTADEEEEEEETSSTTEMSAKTSELTSEAPSVTSSERKIIINLKDIYHCPTTGMFAKYQWLIQRWIAN
jgi:hypothetical protein